MARTITEPDAAATLARVIASDLSLYHEERIAKSLRDGQPFAGLEEELAETRRLFLERVAPALDPPPLLVRTIAEFFARWAGERGLPSEGLAEALTPHLAPGAPEPLALVVRTGLGEHGRVIPLPLANGVVVIGRSPGVDVQLSVDSVARRHTRLTIRDARIVVEDMASPSGTFVNGERVRTTATLALGDVLQVGTVVLELVRAETPG